MGMLSNLGNSIKKSLGLKGPSGEELQAGRDANYTAEQLRLQRAERDAHEAAGFGATGGKGIARKGKLSFGNERLLRKLDPGQRSLRSIGRFSENRLVL